MVHGALPNQEDPRLKSPALADQPASITGPQNLLPSVAGGTVPNQATPAPVGTNESPAGGSKPPFDPTKDRGTPREMMEKIGAIEIFNLIEKSSNVVNPALKRPAESTTGLDPNLRAQEATGGALDTGFRPTPSGAAEEGTTSPALAITVTKGQSPAEQEKATREQKDKINEMVTEMNGEEPYKSMQDFRDEHLARVKKLVDSKEIPQHTYTGIKERWKNIFNVIPREDMGVFLMDFGFRLMVAAENMEGLGSLGVAGGGALAAHQGRRQADLDRELGQLGEAEEFAQKAYGEQTDRMEAETDKLRAEQYGAGYRGKDYWMAKRYEAEGLDAATINRLLAGEQTVGERTQILNDQFAKLKDTFGSQDSRGKYYSEYSDKDRKEWIKRTLGIEKEAAREFEEEEAARKKYGNK